MAGNGDYISHVNSYHLKRLKVLKEEYNLKNLILVCLKKESRRGDKNM